MATKVIKTALTSKNCPCGCKTQSGLCPFARDRVNYLAELLESFPITEGEFDGSTLFINIVGSVSSPKTVDQKKASAPKVNNIVAKKHGTRLSRPIVGNISNGFCSKTKRYTHHIRDNGVKCIHCNEII